MKKFIILLLICFPLFAQEKPRSTSVILEDLRTQITELNKINEERENSILEKENTINELNTKTEELLTKIDASVKDLSAANETIIQQNQKLKTQRKWLIVLASILGAFAIAHFVILFVKLKWKISLPYWLNTLI